MVRSKMKDMKTKALILALFYILISTLVMPLDMRAASEDEVLLQNDYEEILDNYFLDESIRPYKEYYDGFQELKPQEIIKLEASDYSMYQEGNVAVEPEQYSDYQGDSGLSVLTSEDSSIEYDFTVDESGFYNLSLLYYPIAGKNSEIQRSFFIDGELPYDEVSLVEFSRVWKSSVTDTYMDDDGITVKAWEKDNQGNDLKPSAVEAPEWVNSYLYDSDGYITEELAVYLTEGDHTITVLAIREPLLLRSLTFSNKAEIEPYDVVLAKQDAEGASDSTGQTIRIEGENAVKLSSQTLYPQQDQSSPSVYPSSPKELLNNSIGGNSWRLTGQWIEWEFQVTEGGYYNLSMYDKQNFVRGFYVSRKISIDGEVPFEEFSDYGFTYDQNWRTDVMQDENGDPYKIYLEPGIHTIRMEVVLGEFSDIISEVESSVLKLNAIYRNVIRITGVSPDKYRDYQIESSLPGLQVELEDVRNQLDGAITRLREVAGGSSDKETVLITMRDQLDELIEDQERFPEIISSFKINVRATGNWITSAMQQPLQIDRIYFTSPDTESNIENDGFFAKLFYQLARLFWSFVIDYTQIGNVAVEDKDTTSITLWVGSGRDQANVIKALIDKTFTNDTGINVNVQLVDMSTLLRATLVGEGPDVAIQVANTTGIAGAVLNTGNDTPVNYGLRNAVLDLTAFDDYESVESRFSDSALTAFSFDGATYALPETQTFPMMFYRKDILAELGLELPNTWDDVKVLMSVLNKNQMEFGMIPSEQLYASLLYQAGGEYYTEGGIQSALDSDIAVGAFKDYCEFYTDYKLDKETSVEQRFRTGECPIIISDYTLYNNLQVSAPDIKGLWGFTSIPGTLKEDGIIDRSTSCTGLASIIMSDTDEPDASWEFIKWWTSADTQTHYGVEMESLMGSSARVPTANLEAFGNMPWSVEEYEALSEQLDWVKGIPQVPGGYYSWRNVNNAFYTVTTSTDEEVGSPREEIMDKVIYINDEITFKREEFGLETIND